MAFPNNLQDLPSKLEIDFNTPTLPKVILYESQCSPRTMNLMNTTVTMASIYVICFVFM